MFITKPKTECRLCKKQVVNDIGLGQDEEYRGISRTGQTVTTVASVLSPPVQMIPGFNIISKVAKKVGVDLNPLSLSLATMTGGLTLLPGISKVIGGLFKKATHMGDCMKHWNGDEYLRSMGSSIQPYPFSFEDYMMKNFPQFLRQYQIKQADGSWARVGVDRLLSNSNRRARIANVFVRLVRQNPDIMQAECATQPNVIAEIGKTIDRSIVDKVWAQIKEVAKQEEYMTIAQEVDRLVAPFKVKETWGAIVKSRSTGLIVPTEHGSQLQMPENIIGVKRGALVMTLKTPQGQPTSIRK